MATYWNGARQLCHYRCNALRALRWTSTSEPGQQGAIGDDGLPRDYKLKKLHLNSRRLDTLVCKAIGSSKQDADKLILSGKVQLNESIVLKKKAYNVQDDDTVDIWTDAVEGNSKLAEVHRLQIIEHSITDKGYSIHFKFWKRFYVPNWRVS